jgi:hypothetical protein
MVRTVAANITRGWWLRSGLARTPAARLLTWSGFHLWVVTQPSADVSLCHNLYRPNSLHLSVRFQVLTAQGMKIRAFWYIAPCGLRVFGRFRVQICLTQFFQTYNWIIKVMMEAVPTSETSVYSNETTRRSQLRYA